MISVLNINVIVSCLLLSWVDKVQGVPGELHNEADILADLAYGKLVTQGVEEQDKTKDSKSINVCLPGDPSDCVRRAAHWMLQWQPQVDQGEESPIDISYLVDTIADAMKARTMFSWGKDIPFDLFLNEVVPYASLSEPRDPWRRLFLPKMARCVQEANTATEAAIMLNKCAWEIVYPPIKYAPSTHDGINNYSPFEVMEAHNASCTGLSVFLVDALRSVGIPARIAGTPHWNRGKDECPNGDLDPACGNHNWVEVWADGKWHFVDQGGGRSQLDASWFYPQLTSNQIPKDIDHAIYASSWAPTTSHELNLSLYPMNSPAKYFPMVWSPQDKTVPAWDVTQWYLHKAIQPLNAQSSES